MASGPSMWTAADCAVSQIQQIASADLLHRNQHHWPVWLHCQLISLNVLVAFFVSGIHIHSAEHMKLERFFLFMKHFEADTINKQHVSSINLMEVETQRKLQLLLYFYW